MRDTSINPYEFQQGEIVYAASNDEIEGVVLYTTRNGRVRVRWGRPDGWLTQTVDPENLRIVEDEPLEIPL